MIRCDVHMGHRREFEISSDMRVWPCCYFANAWQLKSDPDSSLTVNFTHDEILQKRFKEDPDWNNLKVKSLDDILEDDILQKYVADEGWNSENPPKICVRECTVYYDEVIGKETTHSRLD